MPVTLNPLVLAGGCGLVLLGASCGSKPAVVDVGTGGVAAQGDSGIGEGTSDDGDDSAETDTSGGHDTGEDTGDAAPIDADEDGWSVDEDCDDDNPFVNPGADEGDVADGVDQDCSGTADDRTVCDGATDDYGSIQEGIDDAPDGFVLLICPGTYTETLSDAGRSVTLRSTDGAEVTRVEAAGWGPVLTVEHGAVIAVEGLTLAGGSGTAGGGARCESAEIRIFESILEGNTADYGGGVYVAGCVLDLVESEVSSNEAAVMGGGAYISDSTGSVEDGVISSNTAPSGGGLTVVGGTITIQGNEITENIATSEDEKAWGRGGGGGGVWMYGNVQLLENQIESNSAVMIGGGVYLYYNSATIEGNTVTDNTAGDDGGGIYSNVASGEITNNHFEGNSAGDDGGGLRLYYGSHTISENSFQGNSAGDDGGGLKASHSSNVVSDCTFTGNSAGDAGGGFELDNENATVSGCTFTGNTATRGAGLHSWRNESAVTISDSLFEENEASDCGGGIALDNDPYWVVLQRLEFVGNTAMDGAGLCIDEQDEDPDDKEYTYDESYVYLTASLFQGNEASDDGGAVYAKAGSVWLVNFTMVENYAPTGGGFALRAADMSVVNGIFVENEGSTFADGEDSTVSVSYSAFYENDSDWNGLDEPEIGSGNLEEDPMFTDPASGDYSLGSSSPCIDAGDPSILDSDGSRSDMGTYGGPDAP